MENPTVQVAAAEPQELVVIPPPATAPATSVMSTVAPAVTPVIEAAPSPPSILPPALLVAVPALLGAVRVHHSSPVPEPTGLVVLGFGASTLLLGRFRKRARRLP
jgi:hypothetical protein